MSLAALPVFIRLEGRPFILVGDGEIADAKRRLLERAGAQIVDEQADAALAIVALSDPDATVAALRSRAILVNTVDRPDLCDFVLPAIIDRDPVLIAIGTNGVSAGLSAALRQRIEPLLPANLGAIARALFDARSRIKARWPDMTARRRAISTALQTLDEGVVSRILSLDPTAAQQHVFTLNSADPDDLTLRQARALANADRVYHSSDVPSAILDRARADAQRICGAAPDAQAPGVTVILQMV